MNSKEVCEIAKKLSPQVKIEVVADTNRFDVIQCLAGENCTGIELGVAEGGFSAAMTRSGKFGQFFGVDMYADNHDVKQYIRAIKRVGFTNNYKLLRMRFDEALDIFEDEFFDFIYVDGYAHSGEEGGSTFVDWYKKLKPGGVFSGDDYHDSWPLVKWAVNDLVNFLGVRLFVTDRVQDSAFNQYPSWFFVKPSDGDVFEYTPPEKLLALGRKENERILKERLSYQRGLRAMIVRLLTGLGLIEWLKRNRHKEKK